MIHFKAEIEKFDKKGEKTGWTYILVPSVQANQIKANFKKSFRVKGKIDEVQVAGLAMVPMGAGDFIIALKASLRKTLKKDLGNVVELALEEDKDFKIEMPEDLRSCLMDEAYLMEQFLKQAKSHQNYYINWINEAKTIDTRTKRIVLTVQAMEKKQSFSEMIRAEKNNK